MEASGVWKRKHKKARNDLEVPQDYRPFTGRSRMPAPELRGVPASARMRDLVDVGFSAAPRKMRQAGTGPWYCDLSQCGSRKGTYGPSCQTLSTSSRIFAYQLDSVLCNDDYLALQGYNLEVFGTLGGTESQAEVKHALGEGIFLPSLGGVLAAVACNSRAPWAMPF